MSNQVDLQKLLKDEKEWQHKNPLYKWRTKQGLNNDQCALVLGVSTKTVAQWQKGAWSPSYASFKALEKLTGVNNLPQKWLDWYNKKPKV